MAISKRSLPHRSTFPGWMKTIAAAFALAAATWHCGQTTDVAPERARGRNNVKLARDDAGRVSQSGLAGPKRRAGELDTKKDKRLSAQEPNPSGSMANTENVSIIDSHVHLDVNAGRRPDYAGAAETALQTMEQFGIETAVIMSPPLPPAHPRPQDYRELLGVAKKFPGKFVVLAGGATLNPMIQEAGQQNEIDGPLRERFLETAETMLAQGAAGFGEITALHFSFNSTHPFEMVRPDHPLFLLLSDIAGRRGVTIDLHMEAVAEEMAVAQDLRDRSASNPARVPANIHAFERLLAHNRKATIIWQHAGWDNTGARSARLMGRLLDDHSNLFLGLKMSPTSLFKENDPIQRGAGLKPDWRALIAAHPDRFVLGSDYFAPAPGFNRRRPPNLQPGLRIIELLPYGIKRKVAYENAQRLYRLHGRQAQ